MRPSRTAASMDTADAVDTVDSVAALAARRRVRRSGDARDIAIQDVGFPALLPLWLAGGYVAFWVLHNYPRLGLAWADSHAYWLTAHRPDLYHFPPGSHDAFVYTPAFAQFVHPLALLPWPAFAAIWALVEAVAFAWLWAPLGWKWALPLTAICSIEIGIGNIYGLLAVALVLGLRHPSAVAFPALTMLTPAVGLVWFAARGEWRRLADAVVVTAVIAAASYVIAPAEWHEWYRFMIGNRGSDPTVPYHVGAGLILAFVAARRNRAWLLAPAALLASPVIHGWLPIVILAAIPRLAGVQRPAKVAS